LESSEVGEATVPGSEHPADVQDLNTTAFVAASIDPKASSQRVSEAQPVG
jgi:hypothetical protein